MFFTSLLLPSSSRLGTLFLLCPNAICPIAIGASSPFVFCPFPVLKLSSRLARALNDGPGFAGHQLDGVSPIGFLVRKNLVKPTTPASTYTPCKPSHESWSITASKRSNNIADGDYFGATFCYYYCDSRCRSFGKLIILVESFKNTDCDSSLP